jgi:hypothetical protein
MNRYILQGRAIPKIHHSIANRKIAPNSWYQWQGAEPKYEKERKTPIDRPVEAE